MKLAAGITYDDSGAGGVPIICLHGIGGDTTSFQPQLDGLSDSNRVIAWNMPGYGGSTALTPPTFPALADALKGFLDALGLAKAHLCGQSIGGMLALEMACTYPEYVASLVLIGTTPAFGGRDDSFRDQFVAARLKPLDAGKSLAELAETFVAEITGPIASPATIKEAQATMAAVPEATYRDIIRCLTTFNRRDDIAGLTIPVCLISGEHDQNAPAKTMARMAEKIPRSEYHNILGAGHLINLEAGAQTNAILTEFYRRHS
ncbi:MAG: alpha/beta hydrolase [Proteobacteria bacterium]|nr:alpha/beta hydrolase [Pseudomonadota bacterium]